MRRPIDGFLELSEEGIQLVVLRVRRGGADLHQMCAEDLAINERRDEASGGAAGEGGGCPAGLFTPDARLVNLEIGIVAARFQGLDTQQGVVEEISAAA